VKPKAKEPQQKQVKEPVREMELQSSGRSGERPELARKKVVPEIGSGFKDSFDDDINPVDGTESERSSVYIPRECQKLMTASE